MINPDHVPNVDLGERLARYVFFASHIRGGAKTLKADAFMPPPDLELSTTRHLHATEEEIWRIGEEIAIQREKTLHGRGDVDVRVRVNQRLSVSAAAIPGNPNHAHVLGWPADKPAQKVIAQELAAAAQYIENR